MELVICGERQDINRGTAVISDRVHVENKAEDIKENGNGVCWEIVFNTVVRGSFSRDDF